MIVRCAVYLRVSTRDQRLVQQWRDVRAAVQARGWKIVAVYRERRSAAHGSPRPEWRRLQGDAQRRRFGAVAAVALDRLGRSALEVLRAVESFRARGVRLLLVREGLASDDATGQMVLTVLAGVAQLERDLISQRTHAGLRAARVRGAAIGRPLNVISERDLDRVRAGEVTAIGLARELGVGRVTVWRRLNGVSKPAAKTPGKSRVKVARAKS